MARVALRNVTKVFGGKRNTVVAVDRLSLDVNDGESVVLLGPSGCGKTTTLRLIAGLDRLSSGTIEIDGRVVNEVAPKDRDVALVFQDYALYPHLSVFDNLAFGLKMRRTPKEEIRRRVAEVAALLGIEDLVSRKPHALSGGQRQRVAFGRAIVRRPKVFLFDEPLANLDAQLRVKVRLELRRMHRELGMTLVYVTHDQIEAMALGDRIAILADGAVQQVGTPSEVFERPANRFVAGFLGTPPMNFLEGSLVPEDGAVAFDCGAYRLRLPDRLSARLRECVRSQTVLGFRPERVTLASRGGGRAEEAPPGGTAASRLPVEVLMSEALGDHCNVYARVAGGQELVAKVPPSASASAGCRMWATIDLATASVFAPGPNGANLVAAMGGVGEGEA